MLANNERGGDQAQNAFASRDQSGSVAEMISDVTQLLIDGRRAHGVSTSAGRKRGRLGRERCIGQVRGVQGFEYLADKQVL